MICPRGHESATDDFCDVCGARMGAATALIPAAAPTAVVSTAPPCPHCGTPQPDAGRFCEDCGYDSSTGRVPVLTSAAPAPTGNWTVTITADRVWFEANAVDGVTFPADHLTRDVPLPPPQLRIGRKSASKGTDPELDLADDPGVSHSHAILTQNLDGVWLVADVGSTNGTYVNESLLEAGRSHALADGDVLHVGAWTCITLHAD